MSQENDPYVIETCSEKKDRPSFFDLFRRARDDVRVEIIVRNTLPSEAKLRKSLSSRRGKTYSWKMSTCDLTSRNWPRGVAATASSSSLHRARLRCAASRGDHGMMTSAPRTLPPSSKATTRFYDGVGVFASLSGPRKTPVVRWKHIAAVISVATRTRVGSSTPAAPAEGRIRFHHQAFSSPRKLDPCSGFTL